MRTKLAWRHLSQVRVLICAIRELGLGERYVVWLAFYFGIINKAVCSKLLVWIKSNMSGDSGRSCRLELFIDQVPFLPKGVEDIFILDSNISYCRIKGFISMFILSSPYRCEFCFYDLFVAETEFCQTPYKFLPSQSCFTNPRVCNLPACWRHKRKSPRR